jgi:hypothetical protein
MKAYECTAKKTAEGTLEIPATFAARLPGDQAIRLIVLVDEPADRMEAEAWSRQTAEQFLAGYAPGDEIYDRIR